VEGKNVQFKNRGTISVRKAKQRIKSAIEPKIFDQKKMKRRKNYEDVIIST